MYKTLQKGKEMRERKVVKCRTLTDSRGIELTIYQCECGKRFRKKSKDAPPVKYCEWCSKAPEAMRENRQKLYNVWNGMRSRCNNPNAESFHRYGGRGITICAEWSDFDSFYHWAMKNGYQKGLSIERVDVNGNYCPENCTWIPLAEQAKNTERSLMRRTVEINGETKSVKEWIEALEIPESRYRHRKSRGWSDKAAIITPPKYNGNLMPHMKRRKEA